MANPSLFASHRKSNMTDKMAGNHDVTTLTEDDIVQRQLDLERQSLAGHSWPYRFGVKSWTQIVLVALCAFCLPGEYQS